MNQKDLSDSVIPGLTRNPVVHPVVHYWIPAFAGMTWLSIVFDMTHYQGADAARAACSAVSASSKSKLRMASSICR